MALSQEEMNKLQGLIDKREARVKAIESEPTPIQPQNQPQGGGGFRDALGGLFYGFGAPGRTVANFIGGNANKAFGKNVFPTLNKQQFETSTGADLDTTPGKIGEFVGETGTFVGPGGIAQRATRTAPLLLKALGQGAASFGQESLNQGEIGGSSFAAGATDLVFPVAGRVLNVGGDVLKGLAGGLSGTGGDVIDAALSRPGATYRALGESGTEALKSLSTKVRTGVKDLYKRAGTEYQELISKAGVKALPKEEVLPLLRERFAELTDSVVEKGKVVLENSPFTDAEERQFVKLLNRIETWGDFTPKGLNDLASRISRFRRGAPDSANFDRVVDTLRREVREAVGTVAPSIREANERYAAKMDLLDEIDNVLRTNPNITGREGIRKTAEALGRIFNANKEFTREAIEDLEKELGIDIIGTLAGQQLSNIAPRSTSRIGGAVDTAIQSIANPIVRNAVPLAGVSQQLIDRVRQIPGITETARAALINAIADLVREPEQGVENDRQNAQGN